ncbi:hypothetical protein [Streptomyces sp. SM11]|uniref:hypothetical protein n=1 Tax=Streptomyces sp. SM11 TaxID=565557 RepID=UPI000CD5A404|nr:hypothetical protein [Streptomyces sp. SM11]
MKQPPGKSGLYRIEGGPRTSTAPFPSAAGGGARGGCVSRCIIVPPKPPIDQNVNNGPNPKPAVDRPAPKPDWDPRNSAWKPGDGWDMIVGALQMQNLVNNGNGFTPDRLAEALPTPTNMPGGKNGGRHRDDNKCDSGPGVSSTGHAVYLPRQRYYDSFEGSEQCRATGVYGLLDSSDYNKGRKKPGTNTNDSTQPPGMREIVSDGHVPGNGHLIPAAASGSGIDLRNLVAPYKRTNEWYLNHGVEKDIRGAIKAGNHLAISVVP